MPTTARISYEEFIRLAPDAYAALAAQGKAVDASGLEKSLTELLKIRASQINACAFCLQFHINLARKIGVATAKIDLAASWREAGVYSARERAALAWTEALCRISEGAPDDALYAATLEHFSPSELVYLSVSISTINQWNRLGAALRFTPAAAL
ncbi:MULTISPECIES: carboxymuconolactone decarboxylase family protein [unclassified Undibacterium]|uniref:carboxymuconolactone decarboxylase family protein n=1 Tax=unclassified Undibacterium TaxID=2630295 RepID=UPI002AC9C468|nr:MULTISPECIES: carboxymuconolactone decarboxylase family protein [unclassified Undibacterium]MEB0137832.1 carboxymuconolactone decarboxylase family protein [Undibacterium sp. CCC2.1]MEB0170977.1 carboxymuconolactone decarboxylase family protein [Undibacterium sp. CCC1.1]MEB0175022.1 carboxymuconolactone decarboxylase family protein [Undibacterium sp. CCC3.4]MEB0215772.1 carboxymuconolactone decarboxylase family protein [Undibacterium sp. 5I2]WPX44828.1 carboxymuconolactone decarboxylase fami